MCFCFSIAQCVMVIFAVATFISYGLQGYVPVAIIWGTYLSKRFENSERKLQWEILVRVLIVLATCKTFITIKNQMYVITIFKNSQSYSPSPFLDWVCSFRCSAPYVYRCLVSHSLLLWRFAFSIPTNTDAVTTFFGEIFY